MNAQLLTSRQAADLLRIRPATLYAYVSRGLLTSLPPKPGSRRRLYRRDDVLRLREERRRPRQEKSGARSLSWGAPVLDSELTLIDGGNLYYRGHDATLLARTASFEEVAGLLWLGKLDDSLFAPPSSPAQTMSEPLDLLPDAYRFAPVERMQAVLPLAVARDFAAYDLRRSSAARCGVRILRLLVRAATVEGPAGPSFEPIARTLQRAWSEERDEAEPLYDQALILCADHELNVSAFAGRVVASSRATPYEVVAAGIAALRGSRHGGSADRTQSLLEELWQNGHRDRQALARELGHRLRRGERLTGFGHTLYPQGDPRCRHLLEGLSRTVDGSPRLDFGLELVDAADQLLGERPNVDFGLALLCHCLELPAGSALTLFALGRSAGWIAHALEQYRQSGLIRPRARYTGPLP